ncbi:MAG: TIGR03749 family integrating conjugative element protein, partial [Gammaproteobacteria bacterium]|nr:TIGR03749 family integrating conjugative element protein [Gammaproteobacteria bacterium]
MKKSFLLWCIGLGVLSAWVQADGPMAVEASAPSLQATVAAATQAATSLPATMTVSPQPLQANTVATPVTISTVADEVPVEPVAIEITPGPLDDSPVRVVWRGTPIPLTLPLGKERQVRFPGPVRVGIPVELNTGPLRTQSLSGTVYWTASAPFTARVQVLEEQSGRLYLIDLTTSEEANASVRPIQIVWGANDGQAGGKPLASGVAGAPLDSSPTAPDAAPAPTAPASSAKDGKPAVKPLGYVE